MGDVPPRHEAQGAPRPHRRRQALQRYRQGEEVHPDQGRLQEGMLAQEELPQAPQKALRIILCYFCCSPLDLQLCYGASHMKIKHMRDKRQKKKNEGKKKKKKKKKK